MGVGSESGALVPQGVGVNPGVQCTPRVEDAVSHKADGPILFPIVQSTHGVVGQTSVPHCDRGNIFRETQDEGS